MNTTKKKPAIAPSEVGRINAFSIRPPWGWDDDYKAEESLGLTPGEAWKKFLNPCLRQEAYIEDGFKPVPVELAIIYTP